MPRDCNNKEICIGDTVTVTYKVTAVPSGADQHHVTLTAVAPEGHPVKGHCCECHGGCCSKVEPAPVVPADEPASDLDWVRDSRDDDARSL